MYRGRGYLGVNAHIAPLLTNGVFAALPDPDTFIMIFIDIFVVFSLYLRVFREFCSGSGTVWTLKAF